MPTSTSPHPSRHPTTSRFDLWNREYSLRAIPDSLASYPSIPRRYLARTWSELWKCFEGLLANLEPPTTTLLCRFFPLNLALSGINAVSPYHLSPTSQWTGITSCRCSLYVIMDVNYLPEPAIPLGRTRGGNAAFHNFNNDYSHITDANLRRRLALSEVDKIPFGWAS